MCAINLPSGEPADPGADERVGRKVFLSAHARVGDGCGGALGEYFCKRARIFVTDNASDGPSGGGVAGGK